MKLGLCLSPYLSIYDSMGRWHSWCRLSSGIVCTHGRVGIIPQCIVFVILSYCILFSSGKSVDGRCMPVSRNFSHFCEQITLLQKYQESVGFNFYKEIIMPTIKVLTKSSLLKYRNIHFCYIFRPLYHNPMPTLTYFVGKQ